MLVSGVRTALKRWSMRFRVLAWGVVVCAAAGFGFYGAGLGPPDKGSADSVNAESPADDRFAGRIPEFPPAPKQAQFERLPIGNTAPVVASVDTKDPVAFITIDDGWTRTPEGSDLVRQAGVPLALFLLAPVAAEDPQYFSDLRDAGATVQAHSNTHQSLAGLPYEAQRDEICGSADTLEELFGQRPHLFRPPYGEYDEVTLRAAADCRMSAVLHWRETVHNGIVEFQEGAKVRRGDLLLLHFGGSFVEDLLAAMEAIAAAGLTPARLEDYLPAALRRVAPNRPTMNCGAPRLRWAHPLCGHPIAEIASGVFGCAGESVDDGYFAGRRQRQVSARRRRCHPDGTAERPRYGSTGDDRPFGDLRR